MQKRQKIGTRPAYFDGQLLQAADFIAEQSYHRQARRRHNLMLHDWGVVSGLDVKAAGDTQLVVQPGQAVDSNGNEIDLAHPVTVDLGGMPARTRLRVTLFHRHDEEAERQARNRIDSQAVISVTDDPDDRDALLLATVQLDASGKIEPQTIDHAAVKRARTRLLPGSVDRASLAPELRRGWVAMPFRGVPLERGPDASKELPPPFRIGTTEARSRSPGQDDDKARPKGAGGTMTIPVPFGAQRLLRMRIAGTENAEKIEVHLVRGGFDKESNAHSRKILVQETVTGQPYNKAYGIEGGDIDPEYHTLSLWVRGHGNTSISVVAFEFAY